LIILAKHVYWSKKNEGIESLIVTREAVVSARKVSVKKRQSSSGKIGSCKAGK
jgi:hypothetical protein